MDSWQSEQTRNMREVETMKAIKEIDNMNAY